MRNYWPNAGAEDATRVEWSGNPVFGTRQAADSEITSDTSRSGSRSVRVVWPDPNGSGDPGCVADSHNREGIDGLWRYGCWVYVPSGHPDVELESTFTGGGATTSVKDEWVNLEFVSTTQTNDNMHWLSLSTVGPSVPPVHENLIPNPVFANGLTDWSTARGDLDPSVTLNGHATVALKRIAGSVEVMANDYGILPVSPGEVVSCSIRSLLDATVGDLTLHIQFTDAANAIVAYSSSTVNAANSQETVMKLENQVVPAGAAYARLRFHLDSGGDGTAWVTEAMLVKGSTVPDYFDGDSGLHTAWTGTPHDSTSIMYAHCYMDDVYAYPGETGADPNEPNVLVDISWDGSPFDYSPAWEDITDYALAVSPKYGRANEIGSPEAGTCELVLDNADGRFTPMKARYNYSDIPANISSDPNAANPGPLNNTWGLWDYTKNGTIVHVPTQEISSALGETCGRVDAISAATPIYIYPFSTEPGFAEFSHPCSPGDEIFVRVTVKAIQTCSLEINIQDRAPDGTYFGLVPEGQGPTVTLAPGEEYTFELLNVPAPTNGGFNPTLDLKSIPDVGPVYYFANFAAYAFPATEHTWESVPYREGKVVHWTGAQGDAHPYYPNVKPRRPVRVRALWDGAYWPLFRGHVDRWPVETSAGSTNVTVALTDAMGIFAKRSLENPYLNLIKTYALREAYVMNDGPESFAPTVDPTAPRAEVFQPSGSVIPEGESGSSPSVSANAESIFPNESGFGSLRVEGVSVIEGQPAGSSLTGRGIRFPFFEFDTRSTSPGWSIAFYHSFEGLPPNNQGSCLALRMEDSVGSMLLQVLYNADPFGKGYTLYWPDANGGFNLHFDSVADGFTNYMGGNHIVLSFSNDCRNDGSNVPGLGMFVNGWGGYKEIPGDVFLGLVTRARGIAGSLDSAKPAEPLGSNTIMAHDYRFGMFSVHDMPIDGWDLSTLRVRAGGNDSEAPADRIAYLLDQMGWDTARMTYLDEVDTGSRMRFLNWQEPPNALDELREPASDTNGLLFVGAQGWVHFQSRRMRQNPEVHLTFDHDAGTGVESPLAFDISEQDIINVVNVDNAYGVKTQVRNEASITEYDEIAQSKALRLESDAEAVQFGYYLVNRFGDAQLRMDSVVVNPAAHASGGLWGHVLSASLSTVIGLRGLPDEAPDADRDYFIESVQHEIERSGSRLYWRTIYQVSPASNREAWLLGDLTLGVLGKTTRLHY